MNESRFEKLAGVLGELGLPVRIAGSDEPAGGYPVLVPLDDGEQVLLEVPEPAMLSTLDPAEVGVALIDALGYPDRLWGLARNCPFVEAGSNCFDGDLESLIRAALAGTAGVLYHEGYRFFASHYSVGNKRMAFVLIVNAYDEAFARRIAERSRRQATVLKRVGKVLTMAHAIRPLSVAAVHEITSIMELAAAMLWVRSGNSSDYRLAASVGIRKDGHGILNVISSKNLPSCLAELVAFSKRSAIYDSVLHCDYTIELEAKCCYLSAGGVSAFPLIVGGEVIGVLELISRKGDDVLRDESETFSTIAEHLALALNNAAMYENVERLATYDPLTGIANHRAMQDFLVRRLAEAQRAHSDIGVLMIDVDHFRSFNEEEGHDAGDSVLKNVVGVLTECVRQYDLAARYGGEEFTVIMPGANRGTIMRVAERIRSKVEAMGYQTRSGRTRALTVSIGAAMYPNSAGSASSLLKAADLALFDAKRGGRNCVVWFEGAIGQQQKQEAFDLQSINAWINDDLREKANKLRMTLEPFIEFVCAELALTNAQKQMLQALVAISSTYMRAKANNEILLLRTLESAPELRALMPSLEATFERWNGSGLRGLSGDKIPLLGRILTVLLVLVGELDSNLMTESGNLDPEIVALIAEFDLAA